MCFTGKFYTLSASWKKALDMRMWSGPSGCGQATEFFKSASSCCQFVRIEVKQKALFGFEKTGKDAGG